MSASTLKKFPRDVVINVPAKRTMLSVPFVYGEAFGCVRCSFEMKARTFEGRMSAMQKHFEKFPNHRWPKQPPTFKCTKCDFTTQAQTPRGRVAALKRHEKKEPTHTKMRRIDQ